MTTNTTNALLTEIVDNECRVDGLARVISRLADAAVRLAEVLAAPSPPIAVHVGSVNASGDAQHTLDVFAHDLVLAALDSSSIRWLLSEEADDAITLDPEGR